MDLSIFFAGTAGSAPTARRGLPSLLVRRGGDRILFDCGEGTQRQLVSTVGLTELTEIFLTHFHADHWLGLPGMLKTFDLRGRERPLTIHGPPGLQALLALVLRMGGRAGFELHVVELERRRRARARRLPDRPGGGRPPRPGASATCSTRTSARACSTREAAGGSGSSPGPEFGRVQRGETIRGVRPEQVMGETRPGRKLVLSGDTRPCESLRIAAHRRRRARARGDLRRGGARARGETGHSTAAQAATLAREAEVGDAGAQPRLDPPSAGAAARRGPGACSPAR